MEIQPKPSEIQALAWLAEYRVLTCRQIEVLTRTNTRTVQRRMKSLTGTGLTDAIERSFSETRGRPGRLYSLSEKGVDYLRAEGTLDAAIPFSKIRWESERSVEHQIGVNWVLIHAGLLERSSTLKVRCLSPTSPSQPDSKDERPIIHEEIQHPDNASQHIEFTPDGAISITCPEQEKSLLFFLEVDRSTESLAGGQNSIRQKLLNYQIYFRAGGYKRYERILAGKFNGFRLLFVCDSQQRTGKICHLVGETPPSDFVWVASEEEVLSRGLGAKIWARGGNDTGAPQSILGSQLAFEVPSSKSILS